jgi:NIMA (never in mitosis gene a)-related kinase
MKKVGEGSFGAAILAQHANDSQKAIVKMIDISRASKQEKEDALKESQVLSALKHPYIVRYRESFHEDGWLCIAMDFCEGGDLSDRVKMRKKTGTPFPEAQVLRWFTQAILALKYIHDMHIIHRDLKSGNFFLSKSGNVKLGDFGIS